MIRRIVRHTGKLALATLAWQHRGSVLRIADLARRAPTLVRSGRGSQLVTEGRAVFALDQGAATDTDIRISGIEDGTVLLRGQPSGNDLQRARAALIPLDDVLDVRTDDSGQPTFDELIEGARV